MTRDEIKKLFPEATDEQISSLLSSHHNELNKLKDDNKSLKEKADKLIPILFAIKPPFLAV